MPLLPCFLCPAPCYPPFRFPAHSQAHGGGQAGSLARHLSQRLQELDGSVLQVSSGQLATGDVLQLTI